MRRFYSSSIDYDTELQSSLFESKSTAQLVKFRFLLEGGGCGVAYSAALPRELHYRNWVMILKLTRQKAIAASVRVTL